MALLEIEDLHVEFPSQGGVLRAVEGVSLSLDEGDVLGIVGESGSGKSVTMLALMGLVAAPGRVRAKRLAFAGRDLLHASDRERRAIVGKDVAMIFQEPTTSLNPCFTIGFQLTETLRLHLGMDRRAARKRAIELLEQVGIPAPEGRLRDFPHQMSGGMNQRVMIAMAIACNPRLLIADEPTTALDVTIQAQILDLLRELQAARGMSLVLVTHNMGVVADMARRVAVMYAGQVVEERVRRHAVRRAAASVHGGAPRGDARAQPRPRAPRDDPRRRAGALRPAAGVPVRAAVCACDAALRRRASGRSSPGAAAKCAAITRWATRHAMPRSSATVRSRGSTRERERDRDLPVRRPRRAGRDRRRGARHHARLRGPSRPAARTGEAAGGGRRVVLDRVRAHARRRR